MSGCPTGHFPSFLPASLPELLMGLVHADIELINGDDWSDFRRKRIPDSGVRGPFLQSAILMVSITVPPLFNTVISWVSAALLTVITPFSSVLFNGPSSHSNRPMR